MLLAPGAFRLQTFFIAIYPGANGFGHAGVGVNAKTTFGLYPRTKPLCHLLGCSVPGVVKRDTEPVLRKVTIKTTPAQDAKAQRAIDKAIKNPPNYNLYRQNCSQFVESVLNAAGIKNVPSTIYPNTLGNGLG